MLEEETQQLQILFCINSVLQNWMSKQLQVVSRYENVEGGHKLEVEIRWRKIDHTVTQWKLKNLPMNYN